MDSFLIDNVSFELKKIFDEVYKEIPTEVDEKRVSRLKVEDFDQKMLNLYLKSSSYPNKERITMSKCKAGIYISSIIKSNIGEREKIPAILSCLEPLLIEEWGYKGNANGNNAKKFLKVGEVSDKKAIKYSRLQALWIITSVYLSVGYCFNKPKSKIAFPFRNYVLHYGLLEYSDDEVNEMYGILRRIVNIIPEITPRIHMELV